MNNYNVNIGPLEVLLREKQRRALVYVTKIVITKFANDLIFHPDAFFFYSLLSWLWGHTVPSSLPALSPWAVFHSY